MRRTKKLKRETFRRTNRSRLSYARHIGKCTDRLYYTALPYERFPVCCRVVEKGSCRARARDRPTDRRDETRKKEELSVGRGPHMRSNVMAYIHLLCCVVVVIVVIATVVSITTDKHRNGEVSPTVVE